MDPSLAPLAWTILFAPLFVAAATGLTGGGEILLLESSRDALRAGLSRCGADDALIIAGSFYLAGELRAEFESTPG